MKRTFLLLFTLCACLSLGAMTKDSICLDRHEVRLGWGDMQFETAMYHADHYTGNYRYTETKEYDVIRRADIVSKGIPADGESKIEDALMEAIEPYDYSELKNFSMSYLSGFYADKYDVDKGQVFPRIRERSNNASKEYIKQSLGSYSSMTVHNENYNIQRTDWNYMLLPVWFMTYKYKDKVYEFAMNGQTGYTTVCK